MVLQPGKLVSEEDLIELQSEKLSPYEVARRIGFLVRIAKTVGGKTPRRELGQAAGSGRLGQAAAFQMECTMKLAK